jgi:YD repeat-containing protein
MEWNANAVLMITHPGGSTVHFTYTDPLKPYYLASREDELHHITHYDRIALGQPNENRIWQVRYPDGGFEQFTYDEYHFGLVTEHLMTNGATEHFRYDSRGLKRQYWPPPTESDPDPGAHPTEYAYYEAQDGHTTWIDRLKSVTDPRRKSTSYEYNERGQVTKVTHDQDGTYTESQYNPDGTLAWTEDELRHRTIYEYDEYKRVTRVTNPLQKTTTNSYNPTLDPANDRSLTHTTSSVYQTELPSHKKTNYEYDENFRRTKVIQAPGTSEEAITTSTYDPVGNLETVTDPNHQQDGLHTVFGYDDRNRQTSVKDVLEHTTTTEYNDAGNKKSVTPADTHAVHFILYDEMNRLKEQIDERNYHRWMDYDHAGNMTTLKDENENLYSYSYDELNRKKETTYPPDNGVQRTEHWLYDEAGNLHIYTNRSGASQTFTYDDRNRQRHFSWSDGTSWQDTDYDEASRVTWITNAVSAIHQTYYKTTDCGPKKNRPICLTITTRSALLVTVTMTTAIAKRCSIPAAIRSLTITPGAINSGKSGPSDRATRLSHTLMTRAGMISGWTATTKRRPCSRRTTQTGSRSLLTTCWAVPGNLSTLTTQ